MESFGLLVGHLLGDYIFQNDWMASNKTGSRKWCGNLACTIHCLIYTFAIWICSFWWMPLWGLIVCFITHWPIDRYRLAGRWMRNISGQYIFATGQFSPWSIIVVDNIFHLLILFIIGVLHFHEYFR